MHIIMTVFVHACTRGDVYARVYACVRVCVYAIFVHITLLCMCFRAAQYNRIANIATGGFPHLQSIVGL